MRIYRNHEAVDGLGGTQITPEAPPSEDTPATANLDISLDELEAVVFGAGQRLLAAFGDSGREFAREAAAVVNNTVAEFALAPGSDLEHAIGHAKARIAQLTAIHLINIEKRTELALIDVTLTVVRSLIAVLAPVA